MSCLPAVQKPVTLFPYLKWGARLPVLAKQYRQNRPFPHIRLKDLLEPEVALAMVEEFPRYATDAWTHYKHHNENKHGLTKRSLFPRRIGQVTDELNSLEFVSWLSELTGIPRLFPDPSLEGGGLHQSGRGGFLNIHTDFSMHPYYNNWRRRVNLILYLNPGWQDEWGGAIELWESGMRHCGRKYDPLLNHAVIFTTDGRSLHGFPEPLRCPDDTSRKSLALYYYTLEPRGKLGRRSTNYRARPGDGIAESALIWLDKEAVDLYSRAKIRFGFSDDCASRILGFLSGKG